MGTGAASAVVLVVEDDYAIREFVESLLLDEGYRVVTACDGHEALARAGAARPDVLILDMGLPGLSGFEVATTLRLRGQRIPTILMSAAADLPGVVRAIGAESYVSKPFDCWELVREVGRLAAGFLEEAS